ncbi:MAG: methyltransferase domain-containing protein [Verrucomicrobiota bacterium]
MSDPVHDLYQSLVYPAMSHPSTDPAVTAVAAKLAGLDITTPSRARVLEIGCASGHNLLPLAARWPDSRFTGIDFSKAAIEEARETSRLAGLKNIEFIETDLRTFNPEIGTSYDFIIAHGVYSWVPDDVRQALLDFCKARLSETGVAVISYNTLPGLSLQHTLVELTRQLSRRHESGFTGQEPDEIFGILAMAAGNHTPYARHLTHVLHDLFGKGGDALAFDDFGPINEPCTFLDFIDYTSRSGLRYLGESQLAEDCPGSLAPEALEILKPLANDRYALQQTIDVLTNRTFRSSLLCREDAPVHNRINPATVLNFAVLCPHTFERTAGGVRLVSRAGGELTRFDQPLTMAFFSALSEFKPETVPFHEIIVHMAEFLDKPFDVTRDLPSLAHLVMSSARQGLISLRYEPVRFDRKPPAFPDLGPLRLLAARKGQPIVDPYHKPCLLDDERKQQIAVAMDGTRLADDLATLAKSIAPDFDFQAWLRHLAQRGMFVS